MFVHGSFSSIKTAVRMDVPSGKILRKLRNRSAVRIYPRPQHIAYKQIAEALNVEIIRDMYQARYYMNACKPPLSITRLI